jgi:hypothetical protein
MESHAAAPDANAADAVWECARSLLAYLWENMGVFTSVRDHIAKLPFVPVQDLLVNQLDEARGKVLCSLMSVQEVMSVV